MKLVITDLIDLNDDDKSKLDSLAYAVYNDKNNDEDEIIRRIGDAEVITSNFNDITRKVIENCSNLKYIIVPATGYDWVDVVACGEKGIKILNCPTHNCNAVAEIAIAHMFAVSRKLFENQFMIVNGKWDKSGLMGSEITNKNMLVIGNGNIGSKIQEMGKGLSMNVEYVDSKSTFEELDEKILLSDYIVVACPLNDSTLNLIDSRRISLMKSDAYLINVSRALVVDQDALFSALKDNKIAGAGLDVFKDDLSIREPHEDILRFARLQNVTTTQHCGFHTKETADRLGVELIEVINSCFSGKPINIIN